jgi:hypothetical protein
MRSRLAVKRTWTWFWRRDRGEPPPIGEEAIAVLAEHGDAADVDLNGTHVKITWLARHQDVVAIDLADAGAFTNNQATR